MPQIEAYFNFDMEFELALCYTLSKLHLEGHMMWKKCIDFMYKHKRSTIVGSILAVLLVYIFVYFSFSGEGVIPVGVGLNKNDWLSFLGAYLSFIGTIAVSTVAMVQSYHFTEREDARRKAERHDNIQPIFFRENCSGRQAN